MHPILKNKVEIRADCEDLGCLWPTLLIIDLSPSISFYSPQMNRVELNWAEASRKREQTSFSFPTPHWLVITKNMNRWQLYLFPFRYILISSHPIPSHLSQSVSRPVHSLLDLSTDSSNPFHSSVKQCIQMPLSACENEMDFGLFGPFQRRSSV